LWDATEDADGFEDVFYIEIFADGNVTSWDYLGDEFDAEENCYESFSYTVQNLGSNRYDFPGEDITVTASGNVLTVTDAEGTFQYPRVTAFTSAAFNECI